MPDNAWVEVMRISRFESNTLASERCTIGQVFYWVAFGSGIWINVGRSVRDQRGSLGSAIAPSVTARAHGLDPQLEL